jgi:hypothetical protein
VFGQLRRNVKNGRKVLARKFLAARTRFRGIGMHSLKRCLKMENDSPRIFGDRYRIFFQGCQMLLFSNQKSQTWVSFGGPWYGKCWYFYDHLEYLTAIL